MNARNQVRTFSKVICLAVVFVAGGIALNNSVFGSIAQNGGGSAQRYSVVHTEGTNLIVADNQASTLYFYTIEENGKPGDDLILRGSVDLSQVGKPSIKPTLINPRKRSN